MTRAATDIIQAAEAATRGDRKAAEDLLPALYDELRRLARCFLSRVPPGQTLQTTSLVHEAYLRLVGSSDPGWDGRGHFFGAAAQSMRQIMVDAARRRSALKRGGGRRRVRGELVLPVELPDEDLLALDEALDRLEDDDERAHRIVMLKFFAGLTTKETALALGVSERTVEREWQYARSWLFQEIGEGDTQPG
jgi:RNA polymerase sigma factor (TIGR02999 family)